MNADWSPLTISASKPRGKPAVMLADMGITVVPIEDDASNVDRYVLSKRLAVERRTGSSLLQGVKDKTLFTSAVFLREHFGIPVLIVEGDVDYAYTAFDPQAVRGALSSMMLLHGLNVLSTPDVAETVKLIAMMARQEQVGIPEISLIPKRKASDLADMQRRIVEMLPGCGMVMARDLLQHFGSLRRIVNAAEAEFRRLHGIGAKKAAEIYGVLNAEYESVDTERDLEIAIEAAPELLFEQPVTLLARQHCIYTDKEVRHVVDMVFLDPAADEVVLVELKRGKLTHADYVQIRRYLDNAHKSKLVGPLVSGGARLRGVLATVGESEFKPKDKEVATRVVDKGQAVKVLKQLRNRRLETLEAAGREDT